MTHSLDSSDSATQAWIQFRVGFSAASALRILLTELVEVAPNYLADLGERVSNAVSQGHVWAEEYSLEAEWDQQVPIQAPLGLPAVTFVPWKAAIEMERHLFPEGATENDQRWLFRAAAVLLLHATLEGYAQSFGFSGGRLSDFLVKRIPNYPAVLDRQVRELDATRHLFAHGAGIADQRYLRSGREQVLRGERRPLTDQHLNEFSRAVWETAALLRLCVAEET